ncbi:MAG TPA: hypothetical protein EYN06_06305, partial [Myxococcales bacterium]|nr:hypothetical protein [Myxococcales bacterium]
MSHSLVTQERGPAQSPWLHVALLCVLVAVGFSQVYDNSYQMDDVYRVRDNAELRKVHPVSRFFSDPQTMATLPRLTVYRPLLPLSLSINRWLGGHSVRSYHVGNVLLHALLVCILYGFLSALLTQYGASLAQHARWIALTAAGLFALHPVAGIPVNYICARDLLMMAISFFGACWLWVLSGSSTGRRQIVQRVAAACLLIVALLAKKNAVVAPLMLTALAWTVGAKSIRDKATWIHALVAASIVSAYLLFVRYGLDISESYQFVTQKFSSYEYALTQFRVYALHYLPNLFWTAPIRQAPYIDWAQSPLEPAVLAGMAIVLASLFLAWRWRRSKPLISFCILAWWIMMLPTSSIVPAHAAVVHYRALPSLPFAALLASVAIWSLLPHRVAALTSVALVLVLGCATWQANKTWRTEETLFAHSIKHGGAAMAHHNYATSLMSFDSKGAEKHLGIALERSPNYILAHVNLGLVNINQGKIKDGIAHLNHAVSIDPSIQQTR